MSLQKFPSFFLDFSDEGMKGENSHFYCFKGFTLDPTERRLADGEIQVPLTPKAFEVLSILVERAGHLVEKEELMSSVWPDSFVEEANVARIIHTLRKKLGDDGNGNSFIETVPTRGYRFIASVEKVGDRGDDRSQPADVSDIQEDPLIEPDAVLALETPVEMGQRRYFLVFAVTILSITLVTGFWVSNGDLLPRSLRSISHSTNGEAYRNFRAGKELIDNGPTKNFRQALEYFERAIEIDPTYAEAYAGKADVTSYQFMASRTPDDIANAQAAAKKALELDPNSAYAQTIECRIIGTHYYEFDEAIKECQRAVELDPNDDGAYRELGFALNLVGREDDSLAAMAKAIELSPTSFNKRSRGLVLYMSRRYEEAIEQLEQVDATDPNYTDAQRWLMSSFAMKNDPAKAFEHLVQFQLASGIEADDLEVVKAAYSSQGWPGALQASLNSKSGVAKRRSLLVAGLYAQVGEDDRAFEVLRGLHQSRGIMLITVAREPLLDPLRDDPRFDAILSQMKLK